jgi:hypothetical protein
VKKLLGRAKNDGNRPIEIIEKSWKPQNALGNRVFQETRRETRRPQVNDIARVARKPTRQPIL